MPDVITAAYSNFCVERFPLPSEYEVTELESRLRVRLPPEYRQFLLQHNGGIFDEPAIVLPGQQTAVDWLAILAGVRSPQPSFELGGIDGQGLFPPSIFDGNDPVQILPIGYTLKNGLIWLAVDLDGDDFGQIALKPAFSSQAIPIPDGIEGLFNLIRPGNY